MRLHQRKIEIYQKGRKGFACYEFAKYMKMY